MKSPRSGRTTSSRTPRTSRSSFRRRGAASIAVAPVLLPRAGEPAAMSSRYLDFGRAAWAKLRAATPLTLAESDLAELQGINERVSMAEVEAIYLPLSRLLNLHVSATQT